MDSSKAGKLIAEQMEEIENQYGDSDEHEIGTVITIVEVRSENGSELRIRHNLLGQPYRLVGYLRVAEDNALNAFRSSGQTDE